MVSRVACFLTLALVSAFLVVSMDARSWDVAVAIGQRIEFYAKNGTKTGSSRIATANSLTSLAYDSKRRTMYIGDAGTTNISIFRDNLNEPNPKIDAIWKPNKHSYVSAVVFDPVNETLFWVDVSQKVLMKMRPNEDASQPILLHNLTGSNPWGLAIDICNRYIYWTNSNNNVHTIERSRFNGSERSVIVKDDLYKPHGVIVDHENGKLYWTSIYPDVYSMIERSNLDGSGKELVFKDSHFELQYIAMDRDTIYWSEHISNAIWKMDKISGNKSKAIFTSYSDHKSQYELNSIITRDNSGEFDCKVILEKQKNQSINENSHTPLLESYNNLTTSSEESNSATQPEVNCLYGGDYDPLTSTCHCKKGFTGSHCEHNVCDSFCLNNGTCSVSSSISDESTATCSCKEGFKGLRCEHNICDGFCLNNGTCSVSSNISNESTATCSCKEGFKGPHCERNICDNYCLNNGTCSVSSNGEPSCKCVNFQGSRCEYPTEESDKLCVLYCMGTGDVLDTSISTFCICNNLTGSIPEHVSQDIEPSTQSTIILSVLIAVIGILIIVVGVLSYHVHKLRRRPRIRKRFVVSKGGVTPLTSRPQVPADSCEITIENCCNMNICETPCFEPKLRTPPTKSNNTKKEEKNSLLDAMEGADSC